MIFTMILTAAAIHAASPVPPGCVSGYRGEPDEDPTVVRCDDWAAVYPDVTGDRYEPSESDSDPVADCLTVHGYRGRPDDGLEVIYAPRNVIEWCAYRTDPTTALPGHEDSGDPLTGVSLWYRAPVYNV